MKEITFDQQKVDKNSIVPVYYQLAKLLEREIFEGRLKPGEAIPPENDLVEIYGISRMTVRRAIAELVREGLLNPQKGVGTFVSRPALDKAVFELNDFDQELRTQNISTYTKLLGVHIVRADRKLAAELNGSVGTRYIHFTMVISANEEPLVYEKKYVIYTKQAPILENELKDPSLSNLASLHSDQIPTISKKVLHASVARDEEARHLGISVNSPVFVIKQTIYNLEKEAIGWSTSVYRGDKYRLTGYTGWQTDEIYEKD